MTKTQAKAAQAAGPYIQRLLADEELRQNILEAVKAARHAYGRVSNGKAPAKKTIMEDRKVHRDLRDAAQSLREASEVLRGGRAKQQRKRHPLRKLLLIAIVGAALALVLNDELRKSVLDMLFGAEEEFEYTPETVSTNDVPAA
jgi:hypothetical protein